GGEAALQVAEGVGTYAESGFFLAGGAAGDEVGEFGFDEVGKVIAERAGAGELAIAVGVDLAALHDLLGEEGFLVAGDVADAFGDGDDATAVLGVDAVDVGDEFVFAEIDF